MIMAVKSRRTLTEKAIKISPTTISLVRKGRVPDGAGGWFEDQDIPVEPQVFRLYISSQAIREVAQEGGQFQLKTWEMLCPWDADIAKGDTFTLDDNEYTVITINPIRLLGEIVSKQVVIEEAS